MSLYIPPAFKVDDQTALQDHIDRSGMATLTTVGSTGPLISHMPLYLVRDSDNLGRLFGHLARANLQTKESNPDMNAVAVFYGPDSYISPSWYASKREHGRVVPTWNYSVVHATGTLKWFDDAEQLLGVVNKLTSIHEAQFAKPWATDDAPREFISAQLKGIIGFELSIISLEGKNKLSQNRSLADQSGVIAGLEGSKSPNTQGIAELMSSETKT